MYTHMLLGEYFTIIYRNLRSVIHGIFILFVIENSIIIEKLSKRVRGNVKNIFGKYLKPMLGHKIYFFFGYNLDRNLIYLLI